MKLPVCDKCHEIPEYKIALSSTPSIRTQCRCNKKIHAI